MGKCKRFFRSAPNVIILFPPAFVSLGFFFRLHKDAKARALSKGFYPSLEIRGAAFFSLETAL
jgi:hypothetical protein